MIHTWFRVTQCGAHISVFGEMSRLWLHWTLCDTAPNRIDGCVWCPHPGIKLSSMSARTQTYGISMFSVFLLTHAPQTIWFCLQLAKQHGLNTKPEVIGRAAGARYGQHWLNANVLWYAMLMNSFDKDWLFLLSFYRWFWPTLFEYLKTFEHICCFVPPRLFENPVLLVEQYRHSGFISLALADNWMSDHDRWKSLSSNTFCYLIRP